jgi:hypothetical protein
MTLVFGFLVAPYYAELTPDQIFTRSTPEGKLAQRLLILQQIQQLITGQREAARHHLTLVYFNVASMNSLAVSCEFSVNVSSYIIETLWV